MLHVNLQHGLAALSQACSRVCASLAAERDPFWQHALTKRRALQSYWCSTMPCSAALGPCSDALLRPLMVMSGWQICCMSVRESESRQKSGTAEPQTALSWRTDEWSTWVSISPARRPAHTKGVAGHQACVHQRGRPEGVFLGRRYTPCHQSPAGGFSLALCASCMKLSPAELWLLRTEMSRDARQTHHA